MAFIFVAGFNIKPAGFQPIDTATLATAQSLTAPAVDRANVAMIQAEGGTLRYRDDGTAPTAAVGTLISQGETLPYQGDLTKIQIIRTAAGAIANIHYYRCGEGGE